MTGRPTSLININFGVKNDATGHRNITLQGLAAGRSVAEIEEAREDIVAFSELGAFLDLPVGTYSSGMRMRLSFAVATAFRPEILLLDEWLSAGDQRFRLKATERMQSYVERAGILVLASHNSDLLRANCDLLLWLDNGRVKRLGPFAEVLEAYSASHGKNGGAAGRD
ncbi:MAG: ABC transporter ATP-binding protein, partial [Pseudomonadota bacterium]